MGKTLHGSARTTAAVRRAIQHSQEESLNTLAARHGIDPKTVAKWHNRTDTAGLAWARRKYAPSY